MKPYIYIFNLNILVYPIILVAALLSSVLAIHLCKKVQSYVFDEILKICPIILIGAFIGGKLTYLLISVLSNNTLTIINLLGGFVFYGGVIGASTTLWIFRERLEHTVLHYTDVLVIGLSLGQAIGRLGCYLNGCCYGIEYEGAIAIKYMVDGRLTCVFPTWFCESIFCVILFIFLYKGCSKVNVGHHTAVYLITYSVFRFILEFFRGDEIRGLGNYFSFSQAVSVIIFLTGIAIFVSSKRRSANYMFKVERNNVNDYQQISTGI